MTIGWWNLGERNVGNFISRFGSDSSTERDRGSHVPETLEYGISTFTFKSSLPMHPSRLWNLLNSSNMWEDVKIACITFFFGRRLTRCGFHQLGQCYS